MRRRGLALELLFLGLAASCFLVVRVHAVLHPPPYAPGPREDVELRLLTWNLGEGLAEGGGGLNEENLGHVVRVLRELDPDLVFLQELQTSVQLRRLQRRLGPEWQAEISRSLGGYRVGALARAGRLESFEVHGAGKRVLGVVSEAPGRAPVAAIVLHADAFSAAERNELIGAATESLLAVDEPGALRVLAGDLNLDLDLDKRRDLFTDDLYTDVETYNFVAGYLLDAARDSGATAEPDRRLDYVFVDPARVTVRDSGPWKEQRVGAMDHDPVVVDLDWRP